MPDLEHIAHTCHEANRALQVINGEDTVSPHWADAPEWQIESALDGVQRALDGETPEQLHRSWCAHKIRDGWVYAPEKNAEQKTHPCLVPYTELPPEQRLKDAVFHGIVRAFADSHQTGETQ